MKDSPLVNADYSDKIDSSHIKKDILNYHPTYQEITNSLNLQVTIFDSKVVDRDGADVYLDGKTFKFNGKPDQLPKLSVSTKAYNPKNLVREEHIGVAYTEKTITFSIDNCIVPEEKFTVSSNLTYVSSDSNINPNIFVYKMTSGNSLNFKIDAIDGYSSYNISFNQRISPGNDYTVDNPSTNMKQYTKNNVGFSSENTIGNVYDSMTIYIYATKIDYPLVNIITDKNIKVYNSESEQDNGIEPFIKPPRDKYSYQSKDGKISLWVDSIDNIKYNEGTFEIYQIVANNSSIIVPESIHSFPYPVQYNGLQSSKTYQVFLKTIRSYEGSNIEIRFYDITVDETDYNITTDSTIVVQAIDDKSKTMELGSINNASNYNYYNVTTIKEAAKGIVLNISIPVSSNIGNLITAKKITSIGVYVGLSSSPTDLKTFGSATAGKYNVTLEVKRTMYNNMIISIRMKDALYAFVTIKRSDFNIDVVDNYTNARLFPTSTVNETVLYTTAENPKTINITARVDKTVKGAFIYSLTTNGSTTANRTIPLDSADADGSAYLIPINISSMDYRKTYILDLSTQKLDIDKNITIYLKEYGIDGEDELTYISKIEVLTDGTFVTVSLPSTPDMNVMYRTQDMNSIYTTSYYIKQKGSQIKITLKNSGSYRYKYNGSTSYIFTHSKTINLDNNIWVRPLNYHYISDGNWNSDGEITFTTSEYEIDDESVYVYIQMNVVNKPKFFGLQLDNYTEQSINSWADIHLYDFDRKTWNTITYIPNITYKTVTNYSSEEGEVLFKLTRASVLNGKEEDYPKFYMTGTYNGSILADKTELDFETEIDTTRTLATDNNTFAYHIAHLDKTSSLEDVPTLLFTLSVLTSTIYLCTTSSEWDYVNGSLVTLTDSTDGRGVSITGTTGVQFGEFNEKYINLPDILPSHKQFIIDVKLHDGCDRFTWCVYRKKRINPISSVIYGGIDSWTKIGNTSEEITVDASGQYSINWTYGEPASGTNSSVSSQGDVFDYMIQVNAIEKEVIDEPIDLTLYNDFEVINYCDYIPNEDGMNFNVYVKWAINGVIPDYDTIYCQINTLPFKIISSSSDHRVSTHYDDYNDYIEWSAISTHTKAYNKIENNELLHIVEDIPYTHKFTFYIKNDLTTWKKVEKDSNIYIRLEPGYYDHGIWIPPKEYREWSEWISTGVEDYAGNDYTFEDMITITYPDYDDLDSQIEHNITLHMKKVDYSAIFAPTAVNLQSSSTVNVDFGINAHFVGTLTNKIADVICLNATIDNTLDYDYSIYDHSVDADYDYYQGTFIHKVIAISGEQSLMGDEYIEENDYSIIKSLTQYDKSSYSGFVLNHSSYDNIYKMTLNKATTNISGAVVLYWFGKFIPSAIPSTPKGSILQYSHRGTVSKVTYYLYINPNDVKTKVFEVLGVSDFTDVSFIISDTATLNFTGHGANPFDEIHTLPNHLTGYILYEDMPFSYASQTDYAMHEVENGQIYYILCRKNGLTFYSNVKISGLYNPVTHTITYNDAMFKFDTTIKKYYIQTEIYILTYLYIWLKKGGIAVSVQVDDGGMYTSYDVSSVSVDDAYHRVNIQTRASMSTVYLTFNELLTTYTTAEVRRFVTDTPTTYDLRTTDRIPISIGYNYPNFPNECRYYIILN